MAIFESNPTNKVQLRRNFNKKPAANSGFVIDI